MVSIKALAGSARIIAKLSLVTLAVVLVSLVLAQDGRQASANHTQVHPAQGPSSPLTLNPIVLVTADAGGPGPARTVYFRAKDVHDPAGLAAFEVDLTYDSTLVSVANISSISTWLDNTGRPVSCTAPIIDPVVGSEPTWHANVACRTDGQTPLGVQGTGPIASVTLQAVSQTPTNAMLNNDTTLVNTTADALVIPATDVSPSIIIAKCADFNDDGVANILDIGNLVAHFGQTGGTAPQHGLGPEVRLERDQQYQRGRYRHHRTPIRVLLLGRGSDRGPTGQ